MDLKGFVVVGENIHCTRIVKRGGTRTTALPGGVEAVAFVKDSEERALPVPADWATVSPAFDDGKIKHVALAVYQVLNGDSEARQAGEDYLSYLADRQIRAGATYLDVNVDEYSPDPAVAADVMRFLASFLSARYETPLSIDSSNPDTLRVGLEMCRKDVSPPMINSISLERTDVIELGSQFGTDCIVNAAGRAAMPSSADERLDNFRELIPMLEGAGIPRQRIHLDPLVLPISTDPMNGSHFLEATSSANVEFAGVHLSGGLSNISFGMPNRKLLNMTFAYLCAESGTDGGIIDPVSMPVDAIASMDADSEAFRFAKAVLVGEDMFGMEYITAYREGRLG